MNEVLINNWNCLIGPKDKVYFLGDMAFGKRVKPVPFYLKHLNGDIVFITGSHDRGYGSKDYEILKYKNYEFLILHDPEKVPFTWNGWIIHAHKHNNDVRNYPFINGERKTINVSVEVINYKPVSIDFLLSLDLNSIKRMDTIDSQPIRW
jgi:calcineurin-like phosphoesterase family protein